MYKVFSFTLALFLFIAIDASAQYTSGGSSKRYEEVTRVTYDTIWSEKKIELPVGPAFGQRLAFGLVSINSEFKEKMDKTTYLNRPEYGAPLITGELGGKGGVFMEYGLYDPVNLVNKNLIPQLDLGIYYNSDVGYVRYDMDYLGGYFTSGSVGQELVSDFYGTKWFGGFGLGPMLTYNIDKDNEFYIDLLVQLKFSWSSSIYLYNYTYAYDQSGYTTDYSLDISSYESGYDFNHVIGLNIRKNNVFIGIQRNGGFEDVRIYEEYLSVDYSTYSRSYLSNINLSHIRFTGGFHF